MKYLGLIFVMVLFGVTVERAFLPSTTPEMREAAMRYGEETNKDVPPRSFVYDGCTLFPDRVFGFDAGEACLTHDIIYWYGGSTEERKLADQRLKDDVAEEGLLGQMLQYPVYISVRLFGDSLLTRAFNAHWGFGHD